MLSNRLGTVKKIHAFGGIVSKIEYPNGII